MNQGCTLHASCIAIGGRGVLLTGPSGVGKSDVALRLIAMGADLVADDQTELRLEAGALLASPPEPIAGLIEARHMGLIKLPYRKSVPLSLYVELVGPEIALERLPEAPFHSLLDQPVRSLKLDGMQASTPAKIWLMMRGTLHDG